MNHSHVFARVAHSYGTSTSFVIISASAPAGSTMIPVASATPTTIARLINAGAYGVPASLLTSTERAALTDLEGLGIRLDRSRAGFVSLVGNVQVVDQRTFAREAA